MANYYGTTVSEGGEIEDVEAVRAIIAGWKQLGGEGELNAEIEESVLSVWGADDFYIYDFDDEEDPDRTEESLKQLCPFMVTPLIIKSVGNEKYRYVGAGAWIVSKAGVEYANLDDAINAKLNGLHL